MNMTLPNRFLLALLICISSSGSCLDLPKSPHPQDPEQVPYLFSILWELGPDYPVGVQDSTGDIINEHYVISSGGFQKGWPSSWIPDRYRQNRAYKYRRGFLKDTYLIDIRKNDAWEKLPDFPGDARQGHFSIVIKNALYVWGGFHYGEPDKCNDDSHSDGWRLSHNGAKWVWEPIPNLPYPVLKAGIAAIGSKIYILGGSTYKRCTALDENNKNERGEYHNSTAGSKLWVIDTDDIGYPADPDVPFQELPGLPGTPRFTHAFASLNGQLYALGGASGQDYYQDHFCNSSSNCKKQVCTVVDNWRFDPSAKQWHRIRNLPIASGNWDEGRSGYMDRYIFLIGGYQYGCIIDNHKKVAAYGEPFSIHPDNGLKSDIFVYDSKYDIFGRASYLPLTNNQPMTVIRGDQIHLVGSDVGRVAFDGGFYGAHPDLYMIGTIVPPAQQEVADLKYPDKRFPQVSILYPMPGEVMTLPQKGMTISGICHPLRSDVLIYGPIDQDVPFVVPCQDGHYQATVSSSKHMGKHYFRVEQVDGNEKSMHESLVYLRCRYCANDILRFLPSLMAH